MNKSMAPNATRIWTQQATIICRQKSKLATTVNTAINAGTERINTAAEAFLNWPVNHSFGVVFKGDASSIYQIQTARRVRNFLNFPQTALKEYVT